MAEHADAAPSRPPSASPSTSAPGPRGLHFMLAASALFAVMAVLVKLLPSIPTQEIVFVRSALNVAFTLALMRRYKAPIWGTRRSSLFLRGIFGYASLSFHFYALSYLPLADALVIHNTSPLIVAAAAPLVLGERGGGAGVLALSAAGLLGVGLMVRPTGDVGVAPGLAALGGATMSACAYMTIRAIGAREHPLTIVLYFPLISVLLSAAPTAHDFVRPDALGWALLLGVGLTTTAAQLCLTAALQRERASVATTVAYTSMVFGAVFDAAFFAHPPSWRTVAGAAIVVLCAALVGKVRPQEAGEAAGSASEKPRESPKHVGPIK